MFNCKCKYSFILLKCFSYLFNFISQYLAILFFQNEYKSSLSNLPGVLHDEKELKVVLKKYQKTVVKNSEDVLTDLKKIVKDCKDKEFERIHFHFSGRIYCIHIIMYISKKHKIKRLPLNLNAKHKTTLL